MSYHRRSTPTLKQVAETAGVSITAVSKVLHGSDSNVRVSDKTAEHIRSVAAELKYVPNGHARSLRTRRSNTVGLVFENIGHLADGSLFNAMMLDSIGQAVFRRHYRLTILSEIDYEQSIAGLGDGRLDGVVWCKLSANRTVLNRIEDLKIPCVALCSPPPDGLHSVTFFTCDNEGGASMIVHRMVELGHRRILFVLESGEAMTPDAQARLSGFLSACSNLGIEVSEEDVVVWSYEATEFQEWWAAEPAHTAVFAWNEGVAGNVLKKASEASVSVPKELSVVGFDSTPYCDTTTPKLTAVRQPISVMAKAATEHLFRLLAGEEVVSQDMVFDCSVDERESLARPREQ